MKDGNEERREERMVERMEERMEEREKKESQCYVFIVFISLLVALLSRLFVVPVLYCSTPRTRTDGAAPPLPPKA